MAPWMRRVFIHILPRLLVMQRPGNGQDEIDMSGASLTMLPPNQQQQQQHTHPTNTTVSSSASAAAMSKRKKKSASCSRSKHPPYSRAVPGGHGNNGSGMPNRHANHAQTLDNGLNHAILDFDDEDDEDIPPALFPPAVSRHRLNSLHMHPHPGMGALEYDQTGYPNPSEDDDGGENDEDDLFPFGIPCQIHSGTSLGPGCPEIYRALDGVRYIAECTKREEDSSKVKEDWKYVAMVLDRLFLWIFTVAVLVGSAGIILQAPALYDTRGAIDVELSEIEAATAKPRSERKNIF